MSHPLADHTDITFLQKAIRQALASVDDGGAPFGALVVHNGKVIARADNRVKQDCDATAHTEVAAIRKAGQALSHAQMPEATLDSKCEPCLMCLAAAHWARIPRILFAASQETAKEAALPTVILRSNSMARFILLRPSNWDWFKLSWRTRLRFFRLGRRFLAASADLSYRWQCSSFRSGTKRALRSYFSRTLQSSPFARMDSKPRSNASAMASERSGISGESAK